MGEARPGRHPSPACDPEMRTFFVRAIRERVREESNYARSAPSLLAATAGQHVAAGALEPEVKWEARRSPSPSRYRRYTRMRGRGKIHAIRGGDCPEVAWAELMRTPDVIVTHHAGPLRRSARSRDDQQGTRVAPELCTGCVLRISNLAGEGVASDGCLGCIDLNRGAMMV
jgi:hypothetical protein